MDIKFKGIAKVIRQVPGNTKIYIPRIIADELELTHKEELIITLTESGQIIIEGWKKHESR